VGDGGTTATGEDIHWPVWCSRSVQRHGVWTESSDHGICKDPFLEIPGGIQFNQVNPKLSYLIGE
jgi:hypothetical protein